MMIRFNFVQTQLCDYMSLLQVQHRQVWDEQVIEKMLEVDPSLTEDAACLDFITVKPIDFRFELVYICVRLSRKMVFLEQTF